MRLALKSTLSFLILYLVVVGGVAWWMAVQLRSLANDMAESTAELVGSEVGRALADSAIDQLLRGDDATRDRLERIVDDVTQHSSILVSVAVVDRTGKVIAGDNVEIGRQMAIPELVFSGDNRVRLLTNEGHSFGSGSFHMLVPLKAGPELAGYLRLEMRSQRIAHLYSHAEGHLGLVALAGLLVVGAAGILLHLQLSRRSEALAHALASAVRGEMPLSVPEHDEFSPALAVARRVGRELSEARGEAAQGQQRMISIVKALDIGALVLEPNMGLAFANARAAEVLGCADPADLSRRWEREFEPRIAAIRGQTPDAAGRRVELELSTATSRAKLEFYQLGADTCEGFLILVKSAESLEALESELGLAIQMRGLTRFYAAFVHDLKAPLNAMVMTLELLKLTVQGGDAEDPTYQKQMKYVGVLNDEIRRLDRQLRSLSSHTAPPSVQRQDLDLGVLLRELEALLTPQAKHQRVVLSITTPDQPVTLVAHADRLKQALLNILINALEAMPNGGSLSIELDRYEQAARIVVRDDGPGIPPQVLSAIYDMHFTTKSGGTGVGLYVARSVVQSHGGTIDVASAPGQGTTFTVSLPV